MKHSLSIVVPALNEVDSIQEVLENLLASMSADDELILVDGGSIDGTLLEARRVKDSRLKIISSERGRARQMNAGARESSGSLLLFHHADSTLPAGFRGYLDSVSSNLGWGRFDVSLDARGAAYRVIEWFINWRSRLSAIATGDQSIFVSRSLFEAVGGFPDQPLMEDIELSTRLKRLSKPHYVKARVMTSARKWRKEGIVRTVLLMWSIRAKYALGADPEELVRKYYGSGS